MPTKGYLSKHWLCYLLTAEIWLLDQFISCQIFMLHSPIDMPPHFVLKLTLHVGMDISDRNLVRALFPWRLPFTFTFTVLEYVHQVQKHFFIFLPFFSQHVYALQQLENHLTEGACALDVGSGSGFLTAAMAYMVKKIPPLTKCFLRGMTEL